MHTPSTSKSATSLDASSDQPPTPPLSSIGNGVQEVPNEPFQYRVKSDTTDEWYVVDLIALGTTGQCNCMHYLARIAPKVAQGLRGRAAHCKHIARAREACLDMLLPKVANAMGIYEPEFEPEPVATTEYAKARNEFLGKHRKCAVYPQLPATELHHGRGRLGTLLMDENYWIPVSRLGHNFIDANRDKARTMTWQGRPLLAARGDWNRQ